MKHTPVCQQCWRRIFGPAPADKNEAEKQVLEHRHYAQDAVLMKFGEKCTICTEKKASEIELPAAK
jgi:hypothetical protein